MGKNLSFGTYNKLYNYMFFIVIIRTIVDYIYTDAFPEQIRPSFFDVDNYTNGLLIDEFFMHIVTFILYYLYFYIYTKESNYLKISKKVLLLFQKYQWILMLKTFMKIIKKI